MLMRPVSLAVGALTVSILFVLLGPGSNNPPARQERTTSKPTPPIVSSRAADVLPAATSVRKEKGPSGTAQVVEPNTRPSAGAVAAAPIQATAADRFDLDGADRVAIKFQGYTELSGDYRIGADGFISIPVIGRVAISKLNASGLEALLAERLARLTGRETFVTVEVLEYRNIYVSGFVAKPGAFPWRPGQTVLQALALAGGSFRSGSDGAANLDEDQVTARLQKALAHKLRLLAALARLDAERSELKSIEIPQHLIDLVGKQRAGLAIRSEEAILISRMLALSAKRVALARAIEVSGRELTGLTAQAARLETQLASRRTQKRRIDELQEKGIVRAERSLDEFARLSDLEDRATNVAVGIARIQSTIAALERDRVNLESERQAEIETEANKIGHEVAQLDIDIDSERLRFRKLTGVDPPSSLSLAEAPKKTLVTLSIVRRTSSGTVHLKAEQLMEMRPDDILVVNID